VSIDDFTKVWTQYELGLVRNRVVASVVESQVQGDALRAAGIVDPVVIRVSPLLLDDPTTSEASICLGELPFVVVVPNSIVDQQPERVLQAVSLAQQVVGCEVGVVVASCDSAGSRGEELRELSRRLNIRSSCFIDGVDRRQLAGLLKQAAAVVVAGEPGESPIALYAMSVGAPLVVVGGDNKALEEPAHVQLPGGTGPIMLAEVIARVVSDVELRASLSSAGRRVTEAAHVNDQTSDLAALLRNLVR
jgi:hypothetical protein